MSPNIEIDDEVFELLKANAEPFVDTPNAVLRRLLGLAPAAKATQEPISRNAPRPNKRKKPAKAPAPKRARAASGTLLPEQEYEMPLLQALVDAGGQAPYRDVVDAVGRQLKDRLMPADLENLSSGAVRWQSRLQFVRLRLIEKGLLDKNAPRGVWGITNAGRTAFEGREGS